MQEFDVVFKFKFDNDMRVSVPKSFNTFGDIHKQLNVQEGKRDDCYFSLKDFRRKDVNHINEQYLIHDDQSIKDLGLKNGTKIYVIPKHYEEFYEYKEYQDKMADPLYHDLIEI